MPCSSRHVRSITRAERGGSTEHLDATLAAIADRQGGVAGRRQLLGRGVGEDVIDRRLRSGHLHPVVLGGRPLKGVYAVGRARIGRRGRQWAAFLACGAAAVVSHGTAGDVEGLLASDRLEVIVPPGVRRRPAGITVRRCALDPQDVTAVGGLPSTAWPRTLLDLAAVESPKRLALALDRTVTLQVFDASSLADLLARRPRARGTRALRAALAHMTDDGERTASPLEVDVRWLVLGSDLAEPLVNVPLHGFVVDLYWPGQRLVVEVDSSRWHDGPLARRADHERQAALEAAGEAVLRVRRTDPPHQTLERVRRALAARSVRPC